jgi:hypothetical protein
VVALYLNRAVSDRPAAAAALLELTREFVQLGLGERQTGDDAHPLATPALGLAADAHHGIALARRERRDHGAGGGLAFGIDVHVVSLGDVAPVLDGS